MTDYKQQAKELLDMIIILGTDNDNVLLLIEKSLSIAHSDGAIDVLKKRSHD